MKLRNRQSFVEVFFYGVSARASPGADTMPRRLEPTEDGPKKKPKTCKAEVNYLLTPWSRVLLENLTGL
jgi:hypothetical protein